MPEVWQTYPYLYFFGLPETGKNRAWETLNSISYKPLSCTNISVAALFRCIRPPIYEVQPEIINGRKKPIKILVENEYSTLFLDELCPISNKSSTDEQELHRILNAGYKKGGSVIRTVGEDFDIKSFPVEGFKIIASINPVPEALKSRCIMIQMVRSNRHFPMRLNKDEVNEIRSELEDSIWTDNPSKGICEISEGWRKFALKMPQIPELDEASIEKCLFEVSKNGRLTELYYPLYRVAPLSYKSVILDYLESEAKQKIQTALASFECEIFKAVLDVYEKNPLLGWVSTEEITNEYNNQHMNAQIKLRTVSDKVQELGFRPHRTAKARGYLINKEIIDKLKQRFQFPTEVVQNTLS